MCQAILRISCIPSLHKSDTISILRITSILSDVLFCIASAWWLCQNNNCKNIISISDNDLIYGITECLNTVISNSDIIETVTDIDKELSLNVRRLENEINRMLNSRGFDKSSLRKNIIDTAKQNADVLKTLKLHIGMGLNQNDTEDKSLDIQIRIAEIDAEFHKMLTTISSDTVVNFNEAKATELLNEKSRLEQQLAQYTDAQQKRENAKSRLDEIYTILDGLKNHPLTYDDQIIRQILKCVVVESKEKIKVVFVGGLEVEQEL